MEGSFIFLRIQKQFSCEIGTQEQTPPSVKLRSFPFYDVIAFHYDSQDSLREGLHVSWPPLVKEMTLAKYDYILMSPERY